MVWALAPTFREKRPQLGPYPSKQMQGWIGASVPCEFARMHHGVHFEPPRLPELFRRITRTVSVALLQAAEEPAVNTIPAEGNLLQNGLAKPADHDASARCRWRLQILVCLFSTERHSSLALAVVQSWHASDLELKVTDVSEPTADQQGPGRVLVGGGFIAGCQARASLTWARWPGTQRKESRVPTRMLDALQVLGFIMLDAAKPILVSWAHSNKALGCSWREHKGGRLSWSTESSRHPTRVSTVSR